MPRDIYDGNTLVPVRDEQGGFYVVLDTPIQDGVTWIVPARILAISVRIDILVTGADMEEAQRNAELWLRHHFTYVMDEAVRQQQWRTRN